MLMSRLPLLLLPLAALRLYRWTKQGTTPPLLGTVVLVTGSSSGIGWELARQLAVAGARLLLMARNTDRLQELSRELGETDTQVISLDLEELDSLGEKAREAVAVWGQVDVLVNNGGVSVTSGVLETGE